MRRELVTGLVMGLLIAAAFLPPRAARVGRGQRVVVTTLPWRLWRLGPGPAFGSGPLLAVVRDAVSIAVYLAVATALAA